MRFCKNAQLIGALIRIMRDMNSAKVRIIPGGRDPDAYARLTSAVCHALSEYQAGGRPAPLMVVDPHMDLHQLRSELARYEIRAHTGLLMRTSGSASGYGKLVELSWASIIASARASDEAMGGPGMWISSLPVHHIAGFNVVVRSVLAGCEPLCIPSHMDHIQGDGVGASDGAGGECGDGDAPHCAVGDSLPARLVSVHTSINNARSTGLRVYWAQVPLQLSRLVGHEQTKEKDFLSLLTSVDSILVGGAALSEHICAQAQRQGLHVVRSYGSTETCGGCTYDGIPLGDTQIYLEADGRICVAGAVVALGYATCTHEERARKQLNHAQCAAETDNEEQADPAFIWKLPESPHVHPSRVQKGSPQETKPQYVRVHRTRDIGRWSHGRLVICGRLDDSIITGGVTVMPREVENIMSTLWQTEVVVVGVPDPVWGQAVVAVTAADLLSSEVRTLLKSRCEPGWVPRHVLSLSSLGGAWPLGSSGKIDRRALAARVAQYLGDQQYLGS